MIEHYRGSFGKDEGSVLEEYRRAGIEVKTDNIDRYSGIHKRMEEKAKQRAEGMVLLKIRILVVSVYCLLTEKKISVEGWISTQKI